MTTNSSSSSNLKDVKATTFADSLERTKMNRPSLWNISLFFLVGFHPKEDFSYLPAPQTESAIRGRAQSNDLHSPHRIGEYLPYNIPVARRQTRGESEFNLQTCRVLFIYLPVHKFETKEGMDSLPARMMYFSIAGENRSSQLLRGGFQA